MATVIGTNLAEVLNGLDGVTNGADNIYGLDGNDFIYGLGGNDMLKGGGGADYLDGGTGVDTASYVDSTAGVVVSLAAGTGSGGTAEGDTLVNIENLTGSSHNDTLTGSNGVNILDGGNGNDTLYGLNGADVLIGGDGNDLLKGGGGADLLTGGNGVDTVSYFTSPGGVFASLNTGVGHYSDAEGDSFHGIENLTGSGYGDSLYGDGGDNVILGLGGSDYLVGYAGADNIQGGDGNDSVQGNGGADTLRGDAGNDNVYGQGGKDVLFGGDGDDLVRGGGGADAINGGAGNDNLIGNNGKDAFVFDTALDAVTNVDTISDFTPGTDKIWLDKAIFSVIGNALNGKEFWVGHSAHDSNDYIIYNDNSGKLFYDPNGSDPGGKVQFAQLDSGLHLDASDFLMI